MKRSTDTSHQHFLIVLLSTLLLFSSCVSFTEQSSRDLDLIIPAQWSATTENSAPIQTGWIDSFNDLRLTELSMEALQRNPDLRQTAARIDQSRALAKKAGATLYPALDAKLHTSKALTSFGNEATTLNPALAVSWELDVWGRLRSQRDASVNQLRATSADHAYARLSLVAQTATTWFQTLEAKLQLDLANENYHSLTQTHEVVRSRFDRGLTTALEVQLARSDQTAAQALVQQRRDQLQQITRSLETLIGRYPSNELELSKDLVATPPEIPVGIPSDILERRPDLIAAEYRIAAAWKQIRQAEAARLPRFALSAEGGLSSNALNDMVDPKELVWNLAMNMVTPLIDAGARRADIENAEGIRRETIAAYTKIALRAFQEVETTLSSEAILRQRETYLIQSAESAEAAYSLARERYASGLLDLLTVLEAQRRILNAKSNLLSVKRDRLITRIQLHLALGGDFSETPDNFPLAKTSPARTSAP